MKKKGPAVPAYKDKSTFSRFSAYARASLRDFEYTLRTKKFARENMNVFARAVYVVNGRKVPSSELVGKEARGAKPKFCEFCLAAGTFGVEAEKPGDTASIKKKVTARSIRAHARMNSIDGLRCGDICRALQLFYVTGKQVKQEKVDAVITINKEEILLMERRIKNELTSKGRAPLHIYYRELNKLEAMGL